MVYKYFVSIITVAVFKIFIILCMFVHCAGNTAFYSKGGLRSKSYKIHQPLKNAINFFILYVLDKKQMELMVIVYK